MNKEQIALVCENLYRECLTEIPQIKNNELIWILNGSTLCNMLYNVIKIDNILVSDNFKKASYQFIRQPKGDIDITYKENIKYQFDLKREAIKNFQNISKEQRDYNFVDHNSILTPNDLKQLCLMETKSGLKFYAKQPKYLFIYKYKELLAVYHKELMTNDLDSIYKKNPNILNDVKNLYSIALTCYNKEEINELIKTLPDISEFLNDLSKKDEDDYLELIEKASKCLR